MKRRALLRASCSTIAGLALAGCLQSGPGDGDSSPTESPSPSPSESPTLSPTVTPDRHVDRSSLEVLSSQCGAGENAASISAAENTVTVSGTIGGSDTCDTAKLRSAAFENGTLRIVVAAEMRDMTGTPACGQCLTDIEYEVTAEFGSRGPTTVVVEHVSMGETREVAKKSL